jgi:hypothetical protein
MTMAHIKVTGYARNAVDRMRDDDRGQGTLEYVGIVLAILAILALVLGAFEKYDLGAKMEEVLKNVFERGTTPAGDNG